MSYIGTTDGKWERPAPKTLEREERIRKLKEELRDVTRWIYNDRAILRRHEDLANEIEMEIEQLEQQRESDR